MNHTAKIMRIGNAASAVGSAHVPEVSPVVNRMLPVPIRPFVQRKCAACENEEQINRKSATGENTRFAPAKGSVRDTASSAATTQIQATKGGGSALSETARSFMESRMGADFSQVRIHTGDYAVQLSRDLNAQAFTVGSDIYFNSGKFSPDSSDGKRLLAHELTHVGQQSSQSKMIQRQSVERPDHENVWGLNVNRSMCRCRSGLNADIAWNNHAAASYAACDIPANSNGDLVETCFKAANPDSVVAASTGSGGVMSLPPASTDPCERITNKALFVHETMHSRHTDAIARAQGSTFFREWNRLAGDSDRLDKLRPGFPAETDNFDSQWDNGHDWAQDEVHSYTWQRRFLVDVRSALNRLC